MLKHLMLALLLTTSSVAGVIACAADTAPQTETSQEHGVKVIVTPPDFKSTEKVWAFQIALETHTRPLGDDMSKTSELIVDGAKYAPLEWDGAPPGGHHRKGQLRFKAIAPSPTSIELRIQLSGESVPRIFKWELQ